MHYESSVPTKQKRNLTLCLTYRTLTICTAGIIEDELITVKQTFLHNGYAGYFIEKSLKVNRNDRTLQTVEKKAVHLSVTFRGDTVAYMIIIVRR